MSEDNVLVCEIRQNVRYCAPLQHLYVTGGVRRMIRNQEWSVCKGWWLQEIPPSCILHTLSDEELRIPEYNFYTIHVQNNYYNLFCCYSYQVYRQKVDLCAEMKYFSMLLNIYGTRQDCDLGAREVKFCNIYTELWNQSSEVNQFHFLIVLGR